MSDLDSWPSSLSELQEIEENLKCGICHETIVTPVLTSCCHAYCSLCIRTWLLNKQVCPICSKETHESDLRKVPMVENVLIALKRLKTKISVETEPRTPLCIQLKSTETLYSPSSSKSPLQTKSALKSSVSFRDVDLVSSASPQDPVQTKQKGLEPDNDSTDEDLVIARTPKETPKGRKSAVSPKTPLSAKNIAEKVQCPVCNNKFPESIINIHLDKCLAGGCSTGSSNTNSKASVTPSTSVRAPLKRSSSIDNLPQNESLEPIKKPVYHLMKDSVLKKELKKHGLSVQGDRKTLTARHQKFVTLFNVECDSSHPRTVVEIRQQIEREEKASMSVAALTSVSQIFKSKQSEEEIEAYQKEYRRQHYGSFNKLIEGMKERNKKPGTSKSTSAVAEKSKEEQLKSSNCAEVLNIISDSDSDDNIIKTPQKPQKSLKRKVNYIESDSENESIPNSPVLSSKNPVKRQLRSRSVLKTNDQNQPPIPTRRSRKNMKREEPPQKGIRKKRARGLSTVSESNEDHNNEVSENNEDCVDINSGNILSPTPDLFSEPPSSPTSSITCGQAQSTKNQDSDADDGDALSQLVSLMDHNHDGSSTDYEI